MPITDVWVDWPNKIVHVPKTATTLIQASPEIRELDVDAFRLQLKALEAGEWGEVFDDTHEHTAGATLSGTEYAMFVVIINGYEVTFEDGQYRVLLTGANANVHESATVNQVSLVPFNSAGLIVHTSGSGLSQEQSDQLQTVYDNSEVDSPKIGTIYTNSETDSPKIDTIYTNSEADSPKIDTIHTNSVSDTVKIETIRLLSVADSPKIDAIQTVVEADTDKIDEIHERFALNSSRPVTHSEDGIDSANIDINITDNQDGTFTEPGWDVH